MKICTVSIHGCDASTHFNIQVTDEEYSFLLELSNLSIYASTYSCEPTIKIDEEIEWEVD